MNRTKQDADSKTPLLSGEATGNTKRVRVNSNSEHIPIEYDQSMSAMGVAVNKDIANVCQKLTLTMSQVQESADYESALGSMIQLQKEILGQIQFLQKQSARSHERASIRVSETIDRTYEDSDDLEIFWTKSRLLLVFFIMYLVLSNAWFILRYNYHFIDSMFYIVIIFTSVGYGIEIVEHTLDQFVIMCIAIFGIFLVATGASIVFVEMAEDYRDKKNQFLQTTNDASDKVAVYSDVETNSESNDRSCFHTCLSRIYDILNSNAVMFSLWILCVLCGGILVGWCEGWHVFESIYFIVMSGTTVGFGDYIPNSFWGRFIIIFYLPMVVASTAYAAGAFFSSIMYSIVSEDRIEMQRFNRTMNDLLNDTNFNTNLLLMDFDGDGKIDEKEFMLQVLVNKYEVPEKIIAKVKSQFKKLDDDGSGFIDQEDFQRFTMGLNKDAEKLFHSVTSPRSNDPISHTQ